MKNNSDPMRDVLGLGRNSNPEEWNSIIFLDAQAEGFPSFGKQMFEDPKARVIKELRAYMVEIKEADRLGFKEVSEQLFENYRQEREWIVNQYIMVGGE